MGRSGYNDDYDDNWALICWRGAVASAIRGKRGQAFLREMLDAFDALPEKALVANDLRDDSDAVCAIGAVGAVRGVDMSRLDPDDPDRVAATFGISNALAREIMFENDEAVPWNETPEARFARMRRWIEASLKP